MFTIFSSFKSSVSPSYIENLNKMFFWFKSLFSEPAAGYQNTEVILHSSRPQYFQGEDLPRTSSPFGLYYYSTTNIVDPGKIPPEKLVGSEGPASQTFTLAVLPFCLPYYDLT